MPSQEEGDDSFLSASARSTALTVQALPTWARRPEGSLMLLNPSSEGRAGEEVGGQKQETTVKARSIWAVGWGAHFTQRGTSAQKELWGSLPAFLPVPRETGQERGRD